MKRLWAARLWVECLRDKWELWLGRINVRSTLAKCFRLAGAVVVGIALARTLFRWLDLTTEIELIRTAGLFTVAIAALAGLARIARIAIQDLTRPKKQRIPLRRLVRLADVLPLPTRKKLKAMAGDYDLEIRRLRRARRRRAAAWNSALAWLVAIRIVLGAPVEWVLRALLKILRGA